ncbi:MAG: FAD-dependent oxidoreductase, partial [Pseudolabrys sp.]
MQKNHKTMKTKTPIGIIGGGLGGLAAACTLAARGYRVILFERNPWLGGKAAVLAEQGFRFDMGPTILTVPSVLRRVFAEADRRLEDYLLDQFAPHGQAGRGYGDFMALSRRLNEISQRHFFYKPIGGLRDMFDLKSSFDPKVLGDVLAMRMGRSVAGTVRAFNRDPRIAQMLDHFTQYVGSSPYGSPAVLCGIAHMQTDEGVWYPLGGTGAVPHALGRLAAELGVELRTDTRIRRILTRNRRVTGVETESGESIRLAAVISNCDSVLTHRTLVEREVGAAFAKRRSYEPACSGVVLYLGLNRRYDHLAHHDFVFSRDPHEEFDWIYRKGEPAPY